MIVESITLVKTPRRSHNGSSSWKRSPSLPLVEEIPSRSRRDTFVAPCILGPYAEGVCPDYPHCGNCDTDMEDIE